MEGCTTKITQLQPMEIDRQDISKYNYWCSPTDCQMLTTWLLLRLPACCCTLAPCYALPRSPVHAQTEARPRRPWKTGSWQHKAWLENASNKRARLEDWQEHMAWLA